MNEFEKLYEFIKIAEKNRKYPSNTANGRRAALKLFETVLHLDELDSIDLIEERMKEIYLSLISTHKDKFSIKSLSTYKGRFLKVIKDYKRYGSDPDVMARWEVKQRKYKKSTVDSKKDTKLSNLSFPIHGGVYKIKIYLKDGKDCTIELPSKLAKEDIAIITKIVSSLSD